MSRVLCAWCGADLGPTSTAKDSHGICAACEAREFPELAEAKATTTEAK